VADDDAHSILALAIAHPVRGMDVAGGGVDQEPRIALRVEVDLVGDSEQPEEAIDAERGREREVSGAEHALAEVGRVDLGGVAGVDEWRKHAIAGVEAGAEQLVGDSCR